MKVVSFLWLVWLLCMTAGLITACRDIVRAISGSDPLLGGEGPWDPRWGTRPGLLPTVGKLIRNVLFAGGGYGYDGQYPNRFGQYGSGQYGQYGPGPYGQYGAPYAGGVQGNYPAYNQQPFASPYYPNQPVGLNGLPQPAVGVPGQPYYPGQVVPTQPLMTGMTGNPYYPNQAGVLNPQIPPVVTPAVPVQNRLVRR